MFIKKMSISIIVLLVLTQGYLYMNRFSFSQNVFNIYFFLHDMNLNILFTICFLFAFGWGVLEHSYSNIKNGFDRLCILRLGYFAYYKNNILKIFFTSLLFKFCFEIILFGSLLLFWGDMNSPRTVYSAPTVLAFSQNTILNFVLYVTCSSIGMGVFGVFLWLLIDFIKNKYIYIATGPLLTVLPIVLLVMVYPIFRPFLIHVFTDERILKLCLLFFVPINLFDPGSLWSAFGVFNSIAGIVFYVLLSGILLQRSYKNREIYG